MRFYCFLSQREAQQLYEITIKRSLAFSVAMLMNMLEDHQKHLHGNYDQQGIPNPTAFTHAINPIDKIAQNTPLF